jgi:hypothetical protein
LRVFALNDLSELNIFETEKIIYSRRRIEVPGINGGLKGNNSRLFILTFPFFIVSRIRASNTVPDRICSTNVARPTAMIINLG